MKDPNHYPEGWDRNRVLDLISHYDNQTDDERHEEIESRIAEQKVTIVEVPNELVKEVRALIARKRVA